MQLYFAKLSDLQGKRWDTNYWRKDLLVSIEELQQFRYPIHKLGDISYVTIGQSGKRTFIEEEDVQYLVVGDLLASGVHFGKRPRYVQSNSFNDPARSRVEENDLLVVISGGGSIGRTSIAFDVHKPTNISQDMALVRLNEFPHASMFLFLQSKWGVSQIHRFENGTGVTHLNQDEVKHILVPEFPDEINQWSEEQLSIIKDLHRTAVLSDLKDAFDMVEKKRLQIIDQFTRKVLLHSKK